MSALQWALKFYKWRQIVSNNGKKIKYCKWDSFALSHRAVFVLSPLLCCLPSRALELALHLGKADFHKCLCFPCSLPRFLVPWLCCRQWPAPGAGMGRSSCSGAGRTAAVLQRGHLFISCWFTVRWDLSSVMKLRCANICTVIFLSEDVTDEMGS